MIEELETKYDVGEELNLVEIEKLSWRTSKYL